MGTLGRVHHGLPKLPRGRSSLPPRAVHIAQRERLLRAVIAAVAAKGYAAVTVAANESSTEGGDVCGSDDREADMVGPRYQRRAAA